MTSTQVGPPVAGPGRSLVDSYRARSGLFPALPTGEVGAGWDELTGLDGRLLNGWVDVADALDAVGAEGLPALANLVDRLLEDDGVTYTPVGQQVEGSHPPEILRWPLDPIPLVVDGSDWAALEAGLIQRSNLLDLLLKDIYGPRLTIRRGLLPAELIFQHENYLRAAHRLTIPGAHQLFFHAVDLCRGPDGAFLALGDRTQAPSGSAYAMEGRRVISKVLPDAFRRSAPRGLTSYFHTVRGSLQAVAPTTAENPTIVVLSPGTHSETAFDQAYLATLLGLPLVESADLTVRGGGLWMRAMGRYEPVDVLVRRVDAAWSDPLELRPNSELGVVGLTEACRRGSVTVVNSLGSGVVENPGLLPYLPALARELLGQDLKLDTVPTFWCGDAASRSQVLSRFDGLVIKPIGGGQAFVPALQTAAENDELRRRIQAQPTLWVGQSPAPFSEAPTIRDDDLVSRRVGLRAFVVSHESGYLVMPGALGRVVRDPLSVSAPLNSGYVAAKDVWVGRLRTEQAHPVVLPRLDDSVPLVEPVEMAAAASPRVLEDLFWLGRYAERTEDLTRLLIVARELADTYRYRLTEPAAASVPVLFDAVITVAATDLRLSAAQDPMAGMRAVLLDADLPGTVAQSLAGLHETARSVRDQLSGDTWMVLAGVDRAIAELAAEPDDAGSRLQSTHAAVLSGMLALSGLASENMVRDPGWYLMDIGRRLERGQQLSALLRATLTQARPADVESIVIESVLAAAESGVTYRRRYRGSTQVGTVLELLVLDPGNPRGLAYQVNAVADSLRRLPDASGTTKPERLTEDLAVTLRRAQPDEMDDVDADGRRPALDEFLKGVHEDLRNLADAITSQHFWRSRPMLPLGPLAARTRAGS